MEKFDYIISLGYSCYVAIDLEKMGYHDYSYPFDWVISDMKSINNLIENKFDGFIRLKDLRMDKKHDYIVHHNKYRIHFYHDFHGSDLASEIEEVYDKYDRRIDKFYDVINSGKRILFIRYLIDKRFSQDEIYEMDRFIQIMNEHTSNYKIILISNIDKGWEFHANSTILQHLLIKPDSIMGYGESPLFDPISKDYFNINIRYDSYKYTKNMFFKFKKSIKSNMNKMKFYIKRIYQILFYNIKS